MDWILRSKTNQDSRIPVYIQLFLVRLHPAKIKTTPSNEFSVYVPLSSQISISIQIIVSQKTKDSSYRANFILFSLLNPETCSNKIILQRINKTKPIANSMNKKNNLQPIKPQENSIQSINSWEVNFPEKEFNGKAEKNQIRSKSDWGLNL